MNNVAIIDIEKYDKMQKTIKSLEEEISVVKFRAFDYHNELEETKQELETLLKKHEKLLQTIISNNTFFDKVLNFNIDTNALIDLLNAEYLEDCKKISESKRGENNE